MPNYILTFEARDDLIAIQDFIAQDNPIAAARVIDDCFKLFGKLANTPGLGHKREDLTSKDVRFFGLYSYLIVYKPDVKPLAIIRVLSSYQDIAAILR